jgi:ATP phosphoribosyltransferase
MPGGVLFLANGIAATEIVFMQQVRIALPSKGHLEEQTLAFLRECGLRVDKTNPRQYSARIPALPDVLVLFQRVRDIPKSIASGDVDLGIAGTDTVLEALNGDADKIVTIHDALGYGDCELVVAVPQEWRDVSDLASLGAYAADHGGLRAATKHVNLARRFFDERGLSEIRIVSADGALESAPAVGYADFIVDITSSGMTLHDNHLKALADGAICRSTSMFIGNRESLESRADVLAVTSKMLEFIEANLRARGQHLVFANMRGESEKEIAERIFSQTDLGGLQGPTVSPIVTRNGSGGWWAINIVVSSDRLYIAIQQLRAVGGSGVIVTPVAYIFEERPVRYQKLLAALGKEVASA